MSIVLDWRPVSYKVDLGSPDDDDSKKARLLARQASWANPSSERAPANHHEAVGRKRPSSG